MVSVSLKKRQRKKEKRLAEKRTVLAEKTGLYFESEVIPVKEQGFPFLKYIVNAFLLFGGTFGTLACFITSFALEVSLVPIGCVCVVLSILLAFMYGNHKLKIAVYAILLFVCMLFVRYYYFYINSGMSAIHNVCMEQINSIFTLEKVREYTEIIENRYVTMTMACIALSFVLGILLNIFISEYMNPVAVILLTLPVVQFGIYFGLQPDIKAASLLLISWFVVLLIKFSNGYHGLQWRMKSVSRIRKHKHYYGFVTDANNMAKIAGQLLLFLAIFGGVLVLFVPQKSFVMSTRCDKWKENTHDLADTLLSYGMYSLFYIKDAQAPGKIANQRSIHYDGKEDLKVTLTQDVDSRFYLKNYTANTYHPMEFMWSQTNEEENSAKEQDLLYAYRTGAILQWDNQHAQTISKAVRKIQIDVLDESLQLYNADFVPYYVAASKDESAVWRVEDALRKICTYYTQDVYATDSNIMDIYYDGGEKREGAQTFLEQEDACYALARAYNLQVPQENQEVISNICKEHHLSSDSETIVQDVVSFLAEEYEYTLKPGKVPKNKDYVNYFLQENKKGYCVHFASSAVLLLRYLGVPARYVEGYVIDPEDMENAKTVKKAELSVTSENGEAEEISLSDSNAHAWVEVYQYGLGWVPVEATLAAVQEDVDVGNGILSQLFGESGTGSDVAATIGKQLDTIQNKQTQQKILQFIVFWIATFVVLCLARMVYRGTIRHRSFATKDTKVNLRNHYQHLYEMCMFVCEEFVTCLSYEQFFDMLLNKAYASKQECDYMLINLEQALFSQQGIVPEDYELLCTYMQKIKKQIRKQVPVRKWIAFYLIEVLW